MTAPAARRPGVGDAVAAEWLKIRTLRSTTWFAAGLVALPLVMALLDDVAGAPAALRSPAVGLSAMGDFGQYVVAAFGLLAITGELATRSITATFAATPARGRVLAAKAAVVAGCGLVGGTVATALGLAVAAVRFGELPRVTGAEFAEAAGQVLATGTYLGLLAVVALGIGAVVRRTAGALTCVVVLLLIVPELLGLAAGQLGVPALGVVAGWLPGPAGRELMTGRWEWAPVLLGWAGAATVAGWWALRGRDA
jgi:ABC-2 type transport system permease protein